MLRAGDPVMKKATIQYMSCTPSMYKAPFEKRLSASFT